MHQSRLRVALRRVPGMPTLALLGWWCLSLMQAPLLCGVVMCECVYVCEVCVCVFVLVCVLKYVCCEMCIVCVHVFTHVCG